MTIIQENNSVFKTRDVYDKYTGEKSVEKKSVNSVGLIAEKEALQRRIDEIDSMLTDVQTEETEIEVRLAEKLVEEPAE